MPLTTYTAGEVLTAASLNANFAFAAQGGLVVVKAETAFSAVSDFFADDVFTSTFSNYLMLLDFTQTNGAGVVSLRYRAAGAPDATSNYKFQNNIFLTSVTATRTTVGASAATIIPQDGDVGMSGVIQIAQPQLAAKTQTKHQFSNLPGNSTRLGSSSFDSTTQFDGIEILISLGTFTGFYSIFGYAKTV
jgi:hypothetical protein